MDDLIQESLVIRWAKGFAPTRWLWRIQVWLQAQVERAFSSLLQDFRERPLSHAGIVLMVALGVNLLGVILLGRGLSRRGILARAFFFLLAVFLTKSRADWETFSSESRFIRWLRRR